MHRKIHVHPMSRCLPSVQRVKIKIRADGKHRDFMRASLPTNYLNEPEKQVFYFEQRHNCHIVFAPKAPQQD